LLPLVLLLLLIAIRLIAVIALGCSCTAATTKLLAKLTEFVAQLGQHLLDSLLSLFKLPLLVAAHSLASTTRAKLRFATELLAALHLHLGQIGTTPDRHLEDLLGVAAPHGEFRAIVRLMRCNLIDELFRAIHLLPVDGHNHVARTQTRARCRAVGKHLANDGTILRPLFEPQANPRLRAFVAVILATFVAPSLLLVVAAFLLLVIAAFLLLVVAAFLLRGIVAIPLLVIAAGLLLVVCLTRLLVVGASLTGLRRLRLQSGGHLFVAAVAPDFDSDLIALLALVDQAGQLLDRINVFPGD
jgi:hypothetical protein